MRFNEPCGRLPFLRRQKMVDSVDNDLLLLKPNGRAAVQFCLLCGCDTTCEALAQDLCKEMVIAIPTPFIVQWHDEEIGTLQLLQKQLAGHGSCTKDGITERGT